MPRAPPPESTRPIFGRCTIAATTASGPGGTCASAVTANHIAAAASAGRMKLPRPGTTLERTLLATRWRVPGVAEVRSRVANVAAEQGGRAEYIAEFVRL